MKHLKIVCLLLLVSLSSCNPFKPYSISIESNSIIVSMPVRRNVLAFSCREGFTLTDIEKDIYNRFKANTWSSMFYSDLPKTIYLELRCKNSYGQEVTLPLINAGNLDIKDLQKYQEYKYFKGKIERNMSKSLFYKQ